MHGGGRSTAQSLPKEAGQAVSVGSDLRLESAAALMAAVGAAKRIRSVLHVGRLLGSASKSIRVVSRCG